MTRPAHTPEDGGLAFPGSRMEDVSADGAALPLHKLVHYPGMTLRDWFAGQALQGLLASGHFTTKSGNDHPDDGAWMTAHAHPYDDDTGDKTHPHRRRFDFVEASWTCADAMLAARTTPTTSQG